MNYFEETDFKCRCGCDQATVHHELLNMLNVARWRVGIPFYVKSGFRCEAHNKSVGGKPTLEHWLKHGHQPDPVIRVTLKRRNVWQRFIQAPKLFRSHYEILRRHNGRAISAMVAVQLALNIMRR